MISDSGSGQRSGGWLAAGLREPLVHFVLIGGLVFAAFHLLNASPAADSRTIVVDRNAIITFMQYRSNAFEGELFGKQFDNLSEEQRKALVDQYVREEALYREALGMGLDREDYIIRQRLVQKLEFLVDDTAAEAPPGDTELVDFYQKNQTDYVEPPVYTFTHVFFDAEKRGAENARAAASQMLVTLNRNHTPFDAASSLGDRPLFFQNYVDRTRDFVVSHMGEPLTAALDHVEPSSAVWRGPYESPYGWHLILLTERRSGRLPPLEEIRQRVAEDYERGANDRARRKAVDELVSKYRVRVNGFSVGTTP
ncbi:MAG TPA: peptidylprolyl isomerase [Terriglobia bacterium]|nr:peptidylprolyl isomerase [Terriglobia bacterium]